MVHESLKLGIIKFLASTSRNISLRWELLQGIGDGGFFTEMLRKKGVLEDLPEANLTVLSNSDFFSGLLLVVERFLDKTIYQTRLLEQ